MLDIISTHVDAGLVVTTVAVVIAVVVAVVRMLTA